MLDYSNFEGGYEVNYWDLDRALQFEVQRVYSDGEFAWASERLSAFGAAVGHDIAANADVIDRHPPALDTYDTDGTVVNEIEYHPAQFENERIVCESGIVADAFHAPPGREEPMPQTHAATMELLMNYADTGLDCQIAMLLGGSLMLEKFGDGAFEDEIAALTTRDYDELEQAAMFLTEKQGGSDVGANETRAEYDDADDCWRLTGEKWFCSNLDAEHALVLARRAGAPSGTEGLSLFLVPREKHNGEQNDVRYRRLKDKLGTKSVPTGEVVLEGAEGILVGELEAGYRYMAEMVNRTRLSVTMMGLGITGRVLLESKIHAANREAFGEPIDQKPLMREDLLDMAVEYEAALAVAFDAARALSGWVETDTTQHRSETNEHFRRMHTLLPMVKYRATQLGVDTASYGTEIFGGNGVVAGFVTERLYRDAQIHSIWEGTSNIMCLDVLRAMHKERGHEVVFADIEARLDRVDHPTLSTLATGLHEEYRKLRDATARLLESSRSIAETDSKRLVNRFYDVYAAVLLLAEAQQSLETAGDARKAAVTRRFFDSHFRDDIETVGKPDGRAAMDYYDAIVRFDTLSPEELAESGSVE